MIIYAQKMNDPGPVTIGIYLHGKLERKNGYDLVYIQDEEMPTEEGVYECWVNFKEEIELVPARLYFWKDTDVIPGRNRGLVVKYADLADIYYAKKKFDTRTGML